MSIAYMNLNQQRNTSPLHSPTEDELDSINRHFSFFNAVFKNTIQDIDNLIQMLQNRLSVEEAYTNSLSKMKRVNIPDSEYANKSPYIRAMKLYENNANEIIQSKEILKKQLKKEISSLTDYKALEEQKKKTYKFKLQNANENYKVFRNREIVKSQKTYNSKCEDLKTAQSNWHQLQQQQLLQQQNLLQQQQQQQIHQHIQAQYEANDYVKSNRNSLDVSHSTGEESFLDQQKKGVANLISQMRSKATGTNHLAPLDQNKQNTKVAKMKKDILDADNDYRSKILELEDLRKVQIRVAEETNRQLQHSTTKKSEVIKSALLNVIGSEIMSLQRGLGASQANYDVAGTIDPHKDLQYFLATYHAQNYTSPTPTRYENYYLEGKCKEVLFGCCLETYAIEHNRPVPLVVIKCCDAIEAMGGLQKEGIYRVSGRQTNVEQLKHQFELDEDRVTLESFDVFTIATVLKTFIRELKKPLFDFNIQSRAIYNKSMSQSQRFSLMEKKLSNLSLAHRSTLFYIVRHLARVNQNSQINKMNIPNLAMVFTPAIFHDFNQSDDVGGSDWSPEELFEDLILHHEMLFPNAEEAARHQAEAKISQANGGMNPFSKLSQSNLLYTGPVQTNSSSTPTSSVSGSQAMLLTQSMNPNMLNNGGARMSSQNPMEQQAVNFPPKINTVVNQVPPKNNLNHQHTGSFQYSVKATPPLPPSATQPYAPHPLPAPLSHQQLPQSQQQVTQSTSQQQVPQQHVSQPPPSNSQQTLQNTNPNQPISPTTLTERKPPLGMRIDTTPLPTRQESNPVSVRRIDSLSPSVAPPRQDSLSKKGDTEDEPKFYQPQFNPDVLPTVIENDNTLDSMIQDYYYDDKQNM